MALVIRSAGARDVEDWVALRCLLWPDGADDHAREIEAMVAEPGESTAWLAFDGGHAIGLAEAALRHNYVNGCDTSPVAFLEGLFVRKEARRRGIARLLVEAVEQWAIACGCTELASDALLCNIGSYAMHQAVGFVETERVVFFRKTLG